MGVGKEKKPDLGLELVCGASAKLTSDPMAGAVIGWTELIVNKALELSSLIIILIAMIPDEFSMRFLY